MINEKQTEKRDTQDQISQLFGISLRQYVRIADKEYLPKRGDLKNLSTELELTIEEIE